MTLLSVNACFIAYFSVTEDEPNIFILVYAK